MPFTPQAFAAKIRALRDDRLQSLKDLGDATGISASRLENLEAATEAPSGDEVLILAAHFLCDFSWLIEDDRPNPDEGMALLFRATDVELSSRDRYAIGEFIFLCKCEAELEDILNISPTPLFEYHISGSFYKRQGEQCAIAIEPIRVSLITPSSRTYSAGLGKMDSDSFADRSLTLRSQAC